MLLLSHGYFLHDDPKELVIMRPYPPLGILYISAWLNQYGVEHAVYDTTFSSKENFKNKVQELRPDMVAFYVNLMTKLNVIELARWVKSQPGLEKTLVVFGGPDVTHNAEDYLGAGADVIVIGEGEQTMLDIALAHQGGQLNLFAIDGLAFMSDGQCVKTRPRTKLKSLERLPWPNRGAIDLQQYLDAWKQAHGQSAISISTQRGCPYTCRWCSTAVYGQSYRRREPEDVVDEIAFLKTQYHFDLIWFVDDVFTVSHKWLEEFRDVLINRNIHINFECITRADRLNPEVIAMLKSCGCFRVWIGAESGSQRIIDAMDRRVDVGQVRAMIQAARQAGIQAGTFIMLGYPGETEADILETAEHLKASNPDLFTITVAYPIKGTGLYEEVEASATAHRPWDQRTDREVDFARTYPRRYYDFAVRWMVNTVNWHKQRQEGKAWAVSAVKFGLKAAAARAGMFWARNGF